MFKETGKKGADTYQFQLMENSERMLEVILMPRSDLKSTSMFDLHSDSATKSHWTTTNSSFSLLEQKILMITETEANVNSEDMLIWHWNNLERRYLKNLVTCWWFISFEIESILLYYRQFSYQNQWNLNKIPG